MDSIELRLIKLAQKVTERYKQKLESERYNELYNAIEVCREYHVKKQEDWWVMYDVVNGDGGIWESIDCFDDEINDMWVLVLDILSCNCYLGCEAEKQSTPQDLELQGENIPEFVELLEGMIDKEIDYDTVFRFWGEKMCY